MQRAWWPFPLSPSWASPKLRSRPAVRHPLLFRTLSASHLLLLHRLLHCDIHKVHTFSEVLFGVQLVEGVWYGRTPGAFFIGVPVASLRCFVVLVPQPPSILALGTGHASGAAVGTLRRRRFLIFSG